MGKWADYLISAVKYDAEKKIIQIKQHADDGEDIGDGELVDRAALATNLKKGVTYFTVFNGNSKWTIGDPVNFIRVGGGYSIRTDLNKVKYDNLKMLLEM